MDIGIETELYISLTMYNGIQLWSSRALLVKSVMPISKRTLRMQIQYIHELCTQCFVVVSSGLLQFDPCHS